MADAPIPILMCGTIPGHRQAVTNRIKPEFEVLAVCTSLQEVQQAIDEYFINPSSESKKPQVIVMGGNFSHQDYESCIALTPCIRPSETTSASSFNSPSNVDSRPQSECQVSWVRPQFLATGASAQRPSGGPPTAEVVAERVRRALIEHLPVWRSGGGKGDMYYF